MKLHRYRAPGEPDGAVLPMGATVESIESIESATKQGKQKEVFEKGKSWCAGKERHVTFVSNHE